MTRPVVSVALFCILHFALLIAGGSFGCIPLEGSVGAGSCVDGKDNDGDGLADCDDPDCECDTSAVHVDATDTTVQLQASGLGAPVQEFASPDASGCVETSCGTYCGVESGSAMVECGGVAVIEAPMYFVYDHGSVENDLGLNVAIHTRTLLELGTPTAGPFRGSANTRLTVLQAESLTTSLANYSGTIVYTHPFGSVAGEHITILPTAYVTDFVTARLEPLLGLSPVFADLPKAFTVVLQDPPTPGDVAVRLRFMENPVNVGAPFTLKLTVVNQNPNLATGVGASVTIGPGVAFDSGASDPAIIDLGGGIFSIAIGNLQPEEARIFNFVLTVLQPSTVLATASVTASESDPVPGNNSDSEQTQVAFVTSVGITAGSDQNPVLEDKPFTLEFAVVNDGPNAADSIDLNTALPQNVVLVATPDFDHDGSAVGGTLTATIPTLPVGSSSTLFLVAKPLAGGGLQDVEVVANVAVNGVDQLDSDLENNTFLLRLPQLASALGFAKGLFTTVAVDRGRNLLATRLPGSTEQIRSITKADVSPSGTFLVFRVKVDTADTSSDDAVIVVGPGGPVTMAREGATSIPALSEALGAIDARISVNDSGCIAFASRTQSGRSIVLKICPSAGGGPGSPVVIAAASNPVPVLSGMTYSFMQQAAINNAGVIRFLANVIGVPTSQNQMILETSDDGATVAILQRNGVTVPLNQFGGATAMIQFFDTEPDNLRTGFNARDGVISVRGDSSAATSLDDFFSVNNVMVIQEGVPFGSFTSAASSFVGYLTGPSDWFAFGTNLDGQSWVARNGAAVAVSGAPLFDGSNETWASFRWAFGDTDGDYALAGMTDLGRTVVVLFDERGGRVVSLEGDPVDLDGDGCFNDDAFIGFVHTHGGVMLDGSRLAFLVTIEDVIGDFLGTALVDLDTTVTDPPVPTPTATATSADPPPQTATATPTVTPTEMPTPLPIDTPTQTPMETPTETPTDTPTQTPTDTPTLAPTRSATPLPTNTPTQTPTGTPTETPTQTPTQTHTETPSSTPVPTETPFGIIVVVKQADPADGTEFDFNLGLIGDSPFDPPLAQFTLKDTDPGTAVLDDNHVRISAVPGTYVVGEVVPVGWVLQEVSCEPLRTIEHGVLPPNSTPVELRAGETVTCTFRNGEQALVTIEKESTPLDPEDGSTKFSFSSPQLGDFDLQPIPIQGLTIGLDLRTFLMAPGALTVTEAVPPGWTSNGVTCLKRSGGEISFDSNTASIEVAGDDRVRCIFRNQQFARPIGEISPGQPFSEIVIVKQADPADGADDFEFNLGLIGDPPLVNFSLHDSDPSDSAVQNINLQRFVAAPGTYVAAEVLPDGWVLQEVSCVPLRTIEHGVLPPNSTPLELRQNEIVTCTFRNAIPTPTASPTATPTQTPTTTPTVAVPRLAFLDGEDIELTQLPMLGVHAAVLCLWSEAILRSEGTLDEIPQHLESVLQIIAPDHVRIRVVGRDLPPGNTESVAASITSFSESGHPIDQRVEILDPNGNEVRQQSQFVLVPEFPRGRRDCPERIGPLELLVAQAAGRVRAEADGFRNAEAEIVRID